MPRASTVKAMLSSAQELTYFVVLDLVFVDFDVYVCMEFPTETHFRLRQPPMAPEFETWLKAV